MRAKLVALLAILGLISHASFAGNISRDSFEVNKNSNISMSINKLFGDRQSDYTYEELSISKKEFLYIIVDTAFGTSRKELYLYIKRNDQPIWDLVLFRATNSSHIYVTHNDEDFEAHSKSGRLLFKIPINSLDLEFDRTEQ